MSPVKVKICGLTRTRDVAASLRHGADALGFVFARSPRRVSADRAADLTADVPDGIIKVGLFLDPSPEEVRTILAVVPVDLLQFHGNEDNDFCARFGLPFLKAIAMGDLDPAAQAQAYPDAAGLLLDAHRSGERGGTGERFDWTRAAGLTDKPVWLAGGLTPATVRAGVQAVRPHAVDVSSGVESSPGIKSERLIREFIRQAKQE